MQANHVELPPGELIDPSDLVKSIAIALHPEIAEGLTGMECIVGKQVEVIVPRPIRNLDLDFGAEHDPTGNKLFLSVVDNTELPLQVELPLQKAASAQDLPTKAADDQNNESFWLPLGLTEENRKELEPLLSALPPLTYPMTDDAISRFLEAYMALPQRPSWVPTIITWDTIRRRLEEQYAAAEAHKKAIREEIAEGKISACDKKRVPMRTLSIETLIPRSGAVEYLKRCGLSARTELHPGVDADEGEQSNLEGIFTASGKQVRHKHDNEEWADDEKDAIEKFVEELDPKTGKKINTQKKAAELIGVHPSRISQLLTRLKNERQQRQKNLSDSYRVTLKGIDAARVKKKG